MIKNLLDFLWDALFLTLVFWLTVVPGVFADEPKHINIPVVIEGDKATMNLEFWKHTVDTMTWQADKINEQQKEILLLRQSIGGKCECKKDNI